MGLRLVKEKNIENPEEEILILEFYEDGGCPYSMNRYKWLGSEEDFKLFIKRYKEIFTSRDRFELFLYSMFKDNK